MIRTCNGQDQYLQTENGDPCNCGRIFDDVDRSVIHPHRPTPGSRLPLDAAALPGLELDCDPDPSCEIDCQACAKLPFGESVRKEQLAMMVASLRGQDAVDRIIAGEPPEFGSPDAELLITATGAMTFGAAFASVLGLLLKEAPELAHRAVAIYQDMYSNDGVSYTDQLYDEAEKIHQRYLAHRAERLAAMAAEATAAVTITPSESPA